MGKFNIKSKLKLSTDDMKKMLTFGITKTGIIYWLELNGKKDYVENTNGASFPKIFPESKKNYTIKYIIDNKIQKIDLENHEMNYHILTPIDFPNTWILANARSSYKKDIESGDKNIKIINNRGEILSEYCFGDGINKILVVNNTIWTSYFDEGIFGNYGWEDPIGRSGLVAWDINGNKIYEYQNDDADTIADCYALNSFSNDIFIQYYTEFPFVKIDYKKKTTTFKINFSGIDFSLNSEKALFRKAYSKDNKLHYFNIQSDSLELICELELFDGWRKVDKFITYCSEKYMCINSSNDFYVINIDEINIG